MNDLIGRLVQSFAKKNEQIYKNPGGISPLFLRSKIYKKMDFESIPTINETNWFY